MRRPVKDFVRGDIPSKGASTVETCFAFGPFGDMVIFPPKEPPQLKPVLPLAHGAIFTAREVPCVYEVGALNRLIDHMRYSNAMPCVAQVFAIFLVLSRCSGYHSSINARRRRREIETSRSAAPFSVYNFFVWTVCLKTSVPRNGWGPELWLPAWFCNWATVRSNSSRLGLSRLSEPATLRPSSLAAVAISCS